MKKSEQTSTPSSIRRIFNLFTSDLNANEIERLVKRDAPGVYDFYMKDVEKPEAQNSFLRGLTFVGNLFMTFLMKLPPARRIIYVFVTAVFTYSYFLSDWTWAAVSFLLLNVLLAFELADKLTAKDELEVARDIQTNLMPRVPPPCDCFDISCFSESAREVGGDYYDFLRSGADGSCKYVVIGDVSGKGMGAALHMVKVQAILQNLAEQHDSPRDILLNLNQNVQSVLRRGTFFTASVARLHDNRSISLCRAGHMPLLHYRYKDGICREITPKGLGIGLARNGKFSDSLETVEIVTEPGDVLVFYTDGIVEAMNFGREEFGEQQLKTVIERSANRSVDQIRDAVLSAVANFRGAAPANDDLTLVILKTR